MKKKQWLNQRVMVDEWGRPPSLADVPLTLMSRQQMFKKRNMEEREIDRIWNEMKKMKLDVHFSNNLLYIYKTKGTENSIRALLNNGRILEEM